MAAGSVGEKASLLLSGEVNHVIDDDDELGGA